MVKNKLNAHEILYEEIAIAIEQNNTKLIESMITPENLSHSKNGLSFLEKAAEFGNNHILDFLWNKIPTTAQQQAMILREAVLNNQTETVIFLLDKKNLDTSTKLAGVSASFWAKISGNLEIIQLLAKDREKNPTTDISDTTGYNDIIENTQESYSGDQILTLQPLDLSKQDFSFNNLYQYNYSPYIYAAASFIVIGATYYTSYKHYSRDESSISNPFDSLSTIATAATKTAYSYVKGFLGAASVATTYNQDDNDDFVYKIPEEESWRDGIVYGENPTGHESYESINKAVKNTATLITNTISPLVNEIIDEIIELIDKQDDEDSIEDNGIPAESFIAVGNHLLELAGVKVNDDIDIIDIGSDASGDWSNDEIFYHSDSEVSGDWPNDEIFYYG